MGCYRKQLHTPRVSTGKKGQKKLLNINSIIKFVKFKHKFHLKHWNILHNILIMEGKLFFFMWDHFGVNIINTYLYRFHHRFCAVVKHMIYHAIKGISQKDVCITFRIKLSSCSVFKNIANTAKHLTFRFIPLHSS